MKITPKFLSTVAAIAAVTTLAAPASAMTCVEFVDMGQDDRMKAVEEMDLGGRMAARDAANNADSGGSDGDVAVSVDTGDSATAGGRENARDYARGEDVIMQIMEDCARGSQDDLDTIISRTQ